jgi:hypothetical protein
MDKILKDHNKMYQKSVEQMKNNGVDENYVIMYRNTMASLGVMYETSLLSICSSQDSSVSPLTTKYEKNLKEPNGKGLISNSNIFRE